MSKHVTQQIIEAEAQMRTPSRFQTYLFVALPSDYGQILFAMGSIDQARECIRDAGGTLLRMEQILN